MKCSPSFLVTTILATALTAACVPNLTTVKQSQVPGQAAGEKKTADAPKQAASVKAPGAGSKDNAPAEVPIPPLPGDDKSGSSNELNFRQEVNQAALDFAQNFPNVKAVKTCYSKLYGGWKLDLYEIRGKKPSLQQFQWNAKSREWEPTLQDKEIREDQLKYLIKGEVGDEKCFVLKDLTQK